MHLSIYEFEILNGQWPYNWEYSGTLPPGLEIINDSDNYKPEGNDDAAAAEWFDIKLLPEIAFDHNVIINDALKQ